MRFDYRESQLQRVVHYTKKENTTIHITLVDLTVPCSKAKRMPGSPSVGDHINLFVSNNTGETRTQVNGH